MGEEEKQVVEEKKEEVKPEEKPEGYYWAEVPLEYTRVIVLDDKQVIADDLLIKIANAVRKAGLMK